MPTFLIVDDILCIRRSLRSWLESNPDWKVCGEAENGEIAIEKVEELKPEIVLLDFQMPVMNGLEAGREIHHRSPGTAIILFTLHPSHELERVAHAVGIDDVVSKTDRLSGKLSDVVDRISNSIRDRRVA